MNSSVTTLAPLAEASKWDMSMSHLLPLMTMIASAFQGATQQPPRNEPAPVPTTPEPEPELIPEPEPLRVIAMNPVRAQIEPEMEIKVAQSEPPPLYGRVREPAVYGSARQGREAIWDEAVDEPKQNWAVGPSRKRNRGNFDDYVRPTVGVEEVAEHLAPQDEFRLDPTLQVSKAAAEARIARKAQQYQLDLTKQGIKKRRVMHAESESLLNTAKLQMATIMSQRKNAPQEEKIMIWAESLRKLAH